MTVGQRNQPGFLSLEFVMPALVVLCGVGTWFFFAKWAWQGELQFLPYAFVSFLFFSSFFIFFVLAKPPFLMRLIVYVLILLSAFAILFRLEAVSLSSLLLALVIFLLAGWRVDATEGSLLKVSLSRVARAGLPFFFLAVGLLLTTGLYLAPVSAEILALPIPQAAYDYAFTQIDPFTQGLIGVSFDAPLDELLATTFSIIDAEKLAPVRDAHRPALLAAHASGDPELLASARAQYAQAVEQIFSREQTQALAQVRDEYGLKLGMKLEGVTPVAEFLYEILSRQLEVWRAVTFDVLMFAFVASAFFLWQTLSIPLQWAAILFMLAFFNLLRLTPFVVISKVPAQREIIEFRYQAGKLPEQDAKKKV